MKCILCNSNTKPIKHLKIEFILDALKKYFNQDKIPQDIIENEYKIHKCCNCKLEFAAPMKSGNKHFYEWVTNFEDYYSKDRWEYNLLSRLWENDKTDYLLDIGCGDGAFFDFLVKKNISKTFYGIDLNENSVNKCREKGYNVELGKIENINFNLKFNKITGFHILEHVENPLELLKNMKDKLSENGEIYLSVPYSPMHFETTWFDPLNYPPHHLTRWNYNSLRELSKQLNMNFSFFINESQTFYQRAKSTIKIKRIKGEKTAYFDKILEIYFQFFRKRVNGKVPGDIILIKLF